VEKVNEKIKDKFLFTKHFALKVSLFTIDTSQNFYDSRKKFTQIQKESLNFSDE
jgi:hypothetical protein